MSESKIFVFHSDQARFAGGTFSSLEKAEEWIYRHELSGILTAYPVNIGVYDWAIEKEFFTPKNDKQKTPQFIGGFTTASQEHYHYENGESAF